MKRESRHTLRNELAGPMSGAPAPWLLGSLRQLRLPAVLAALAVVALCLAFVDVVSGAVQQGQARKQSQFSQSEATWRCNAQRDRQLRIDCRAELATGGNVRQAVLQEPQLTAAGLRDPQ